MKTVRAVVVAALLGATGAGPALACSVLPPPIPPQLMMFPGESAESYEQRSKDHTEGFFAIQAQRKQEAVEKTQSDLWEASGAVAVVEVVSIKRDLPIGEKDRPYGRGNEARVKVVSWIKGEKLPMASLTLAHKDFTSCGAMPMWRVLYGEPGQRFVLFFKTGKPAQGDVLGEAEPAAIVAPGIISALAAKAK